MLKLGSVLRAIAFTGSLGALAAIFFPIASSAQSRLPPCPAGDARLWSDCQGSSVYPDGGTYVGEFRNGKPSGQGTQIFSDGRKYVGEWRDGHLNGQGILTYSRHGEYAGAFLNDKPEGQGTFSYPDGRKYVGAWRDGKFNGQGAFIYPDGRKEVGEFRENRLLKAPTADTSSSISEPPRGVSDDSLLLILMVLLVGGGIAAALVSSRRKTALAPSPAGSAGYDLQSRRSRVDEALRLLRDIADDFNVPDGRLLELRREARRALEELKELNRASAKAGPLRFLRFW